MVRLSLVVAVALFAACGPLTPPGVDAGSTGGGAATGGGITGGGGGLTGGGGGLTGGGGSVGGGAATGGGGGGATGGGGAADAGVAPLSWATMSLTGGSGSGPIVGLGGVPTDLWALQDNGNLYRSTGGAFQFLFKFTGGAKDLHVAGNLVVAVLFREIVFCTANCTTEAAFTRIDLINPGLDGESACGKDESNVAVIVSDVNYVGQLYEWNGMTFVRTNSNLGLKDPRGCWYDSTGALNVAGRDGVVQIDTGAVSPQSITGTTGTGFYSGVDLDGTSWASGMSGKIARRVGATWAVTPTTSTNILWAVGGLRADEIFAVGYYDSNVGNGYRWDGTTLRPLGAALPSAGSQSTLRTIHAASTTQLFIGGNDATGPVILRGRR